MKRTEKNIVAGDIMPGWFVEIWHNFTYHDKPLKKIKKIEVEFELEK